MFYLIYLSKPKKPSQLNQVISTTLWSHSWHISDTNVCISARH